MQVDAGGSGGFSLGGGLGGIGGALGLGGSAEVETPDVDVNDDVSDHTKLSV